MTAKLTQDLVLKKLRTYARRWGGDIIELSTTEFEAKADENPLGLEADELPQFCEDPVLSAELEDNRTFSSAPFSNWNIGTEHVERKIYFADNGRPSDVASFSTSLIHEMGHVFACLEEPHKMQGEAEFDFFGWEIILAQTIGLSLKDFHTGNADYVVDPTGSLNIHDLLTGTRMERKLIKEIFTEQVKIATRKGLLKRGRPVSIRI